ncbi:MAG: xanthine dehydrogenase family protein subunit M [Myxococcales bacterium]|nr:xanthine dehydrogenase family protein subunit M [Myxococcales bacterium]MDH3844172.1 xanthine dehydrogenase family protein subunit M [Myxococcales bacterium]
MIPGAFDYHSPRSLDEALSLLKQHAGDAKILAGGQSLIPAMRFRLAMPAILIDINRLNDLRYVEERGDHLAIGAMTREHSLEDSSIVKSSYPLLHDTAVVIADPLVRNQATVGGNIAHADPANDHPATMLAYNATVVAKGPKGERTIAIDDFFTGLFENAMADDEILTEIRIPKPAAKSGGAYTKLERKVGDYAISAAAVQVRLDGDKVAEARIGLTNVSAVPMRAKGAEAELVGKSISDVVVEAAGKAAAAECDPSPDLRGGVDYKRDITRVMVKRSIQRAVARAKGGK